MSVLKLLFLLTSVSQSSLKFVPLGWLNFSWSLWIPQGFSHPWVIAKTEDLIVDESLDLLFCSLTDVTLLLFFVLHHLLIWCVPLIVFYMLNHHHISGIHPTWSWFVIH